MGQLATIRRVELTVYQLSTAADAMFGVSTIYKLGYAWFTYGTFKGKLQFVNFPTQVFFPEDKDADGFQWQLHPGNHAFAQPHYGVSPAVIRLIGSIIDPFSGAIANLQAGP
jgi:hypothetical protein